MVNSSGMGFDTGIRTALLVLEEGLTGMLNLMFSCGFGQSGRRWSSLSQLKHLVRDCEAPPEGVWVERAAAGLVLVDFV